MILKRLGRRLLTRGPQYLAGACSFSSMKRSLSENMLMLLTERSCCKQLRIVSTRSRSIKPTAKQPDILAGLLFVIVQGLSERMSYSSNSFPASDKTVLYDVVKRRTNQTTCLCTTARAQNRLPTAASSRGHSGVGTLRLDVDIPALDLREQGYALLLSPCICMPKWLKAPTKEPIASEEAMRDAP